MATRERQTSGSWQSAEGTAAGGHKRSTPDLLVLLHGRTCPCCREATVCVVEVGGLELLTCGTGCPGERIQRAFIAAELANMTQAGTRTRVEGEKHPTGVSRDRPLVSRAEAATTLREFPKLSSRAIAELCGVSPQTVLARPENVSKVDSCPPVTGQDGKQYPAHREPRQAEVETQAPSALLPAFDAFRRFELRSSVAPELRPALELLLQADVDADHDLPLRTSLQSAVALLAGGALPQAEPVGPVAEFGRAVADVAVEMLLDCDRSERLRLAGLIHSLLLEAQRVRPRLAKLGRAA